VSEYLVKVVEADGGSAQPHYIRTIKPNQNRSPTEYDDKAILHQIKYLGLQENIRVRRAGFAYRAEFSKMIQRFYLLSPATSYAGDYIWEGDDRSGCERILQDAKIAKDEWQMGVTKAFIKNPETVRTHLRRTDNSSSTSKASVIGTGTPWPVVFSELGVRTFAESRKLRQRFSGSGKTRKRGWSMPERGIMGTRSWRAEKRGGE
jgi:hypothetical protein